MLYTGDPCGENLQWTLDVETGVLSITGSGNMTAYANAEDAPWSAYANQIRQISISTDVASVSATAFAGCSVLESFAVADENTNLKSIDGVLYSKDGKMLLSYPRGNAAATYTVPQGVKTIGKNAFYDCAALATVEIPMTVVNIDEDAIVYTDANAEKLTIRCKQCLFVQIRNGIRAKICPFNAKVCPFHAKVYWLLSKGLPYSAKFHGKRLHCIQITKPCHSRTLILIE